MSAQLLSSKLVVQEEPPTFRTIAGVATGVTACLGFAERGPVGAPTLLTSHADFVKIYGGDVSYAASAVRGFFNNGGERMYFSRVVHYGDPANLATRTSKAGRLELKNAPGVAGPATLTGSAIGPFALSNGDTLQVAADGAAAATATFAGTSAEIVNASPYIAMGGGTIVGKTMQLSVDGAAAQLVTFQAADFVDGTNPTGEEVADALNTVLLGATVTAAGNILTIKSNVAGTDSAVQISGGTAVSLLGFSVAVATGSGNVADISAVTVAEVKAIVEAAVSGVTVANVNGAVRMSATTSGSSGSLQVLAASSADDELGLDNFAHPGVTGVVESTLEVIAKYDGSYASNVTITVGPATSGIASEFNLSVLYSAVVVETFPNLTMDETSPRFAPTVVNAVDGSRYIGLIDLNVSPGPGGAMIERPANCPGSPAVAFGPLVGGDDGMLNVTEADFIGDVSAHTGLHAFDLTSDIELLICPEYATPGIQNAALSYVSVHRKGELYFIADPPAGMTAEGINTYVMATASLKNTTECGAMYWPRVRVVNPSAARFGNVSTLTVPPSGHIAGMFARNDGARVGGVYQPPGGVERGQLAGVVGLEDESVNDERIRDLIAPNCINPICKHRGYPIAVDDVMTLSPGGNFPTIAERRGVTFIERSIKDALQFTRLRNNDDALRTQMKRMATAFLLSQMRVGAFRSQVPSTAFFVDASAAINPPSEVFAGRVHLRIGLATQKPARFVILSFSQDTRALDEELAAAG